MTTRIHTRPGRAATGTGDAVRLTALTRVYGTGPQAVTALDGATVVFPAGTFTAVIGPSGSGKSTLLQCAAGLDRATQGTVTIAGTDLGPLGERALTVLRRERIGFIFQAFNLVSALTAEQNVALPLRLAGRRPARAEVLAVLAEVGLADRAGHRPVELSGGQQQRVAIARALVTRPAVIFADEPTGALDTLTSRDVLALLRTVVDRHAQTVIMVTHDPAAAAWADQVLFLADGRLIDEMSTRVGGTGGGPGDGIGGGPAGRPLGPVAEAIAARMAAAQSAVEPAMDPTVDGAVAGGAA